MTFRSPLSSGRAQVLHLLLVLAMLLAQCAAYAHVSAHLRAPGDDSGIASKATPLCSQCLEGAPLLGAAGVPHVPSIVRVAVSPERITVFPRAFVEQRTHYGFRSRAPPASL